MANKVRPSFRQKETFKNMVGNGGKLEPAMKAAGFSKAYAESHKLEKTISWQELLDRDLPDDLLSKVAMEGLRADKVVSATVIIKKGALPQDGSLPEADSKTMDFIEVPDHPTRQRFLETSLKMKNKIVERTDFTSDGEKIGGFVVVKTEKAE
jgi:hypothetical protein